MPAPDDPLVQALREWVEKAEHDLTAALAHQHKQS